MSSSANVKTKIAELVTLVEGARSMPMSASCVVNRGEMLALLSELAELLPAELRRAQGVLREREQVIESGREEAERIIAAAHEERAQMISRSEIAAEAARESERVLIEARTVSDQMKREVDDYVDGKLANFEVVLTKTLLAVERGRDKLSGRVESDDLRSLGGELDETPLPG